MSDFDIYKCPDPKCDMGRVPVNQGEGVANCPLCVDRYNAWKAGRAQGRREGMEEAAEIAAREVGSRMCESTGRRIAQAIRKAIKQDDTDE